MFALRLLICFKSKLLGNSEHIFVKRIEGDILFSAIFSKVKSGSNMYCIQTSASGKFFVLYYDLLNGTIYRFTMYIVEHSIKFVHFLKQKSLSLCTDIL